MTEFLIFKMSVIIVAILGTALVINTLKLGKKLYYRLKLMHSVNVRGRRALSRC